MPAATVGAWSSCRTGRSCPSAARIRLTSRVASSEWPPSSKKLSSTPTAAGRAPRRTARTSDLPPAGCAAAGARPALTRRRGRAGPRGPACRWGSAAARRARRTPRDHVLGQQPRATRCAASVGLGGAVGRDDVGDQRCPVGSRTTTAAWATAAGCRPATASISPGSIRKPRILTWSSARPRNSQLAVARSSGPGRRCGTSARRRRRTGRRRTARRSAPAGRGSRGPARRRPCTARRDAGRHRAAGRRRARRPGCSASAGRSAAGACPDAARRVVVAHRWSRSGRRR